MKDHRLQRQRACALLSLCLALSAGCPPRAKEVSDASTADASDLVGNAADACNDPAGPDVSWVGPEGFAEQEMILEQKMLVACRVVPRKGENEAPVDSQSVAIQVLDSNGKVLQSPKVSSAGASRFEATIDFAEESNGALKVRCIAKDTSREARCAGAVLEADLDLGPKIEVLSPDVDATLSNAVNIRFKVDAAPLASDDEAGKKLTTPEVELSGQPIEVSRDGDDFIASVPFEDAKRFARPLSGPQELVIRASNSRKPKPGTREVTIPFYADSAGPEIEISKPRNGEQAGSSLFVSVRVSDDGAGVDPSSVFMRAGERETALAARSEGSATFEGSFDTSRIDPNVRELTVNVVAKDRAGNAGVAAVVVKLDTRAPLVSLDPPPVREIVEETANLVCSELFDPVGDDSANDGDVVDMNMELRVRAEDRGNGEDERSEVLFIAGIDEEQARLYAAPSEGPPLLVDLSGDGVCDAINPDREPRSGNADAALVIPLAAATPRGGATFLEDAVTTSFPAALAPAYVGLDGAAFDACGSPKKARLPTPVCASSDLTRIIRASGFTTNEPAIFGKAPIKPITCAGDAFDFREALPEGWACVAAWVPDKLGNVGLSAPLRLCLTDNQGASECGAEVGSSLPENQRPSCTDGCTPPASFDAFPFRQLVF